MNLPTRNDYKQIVLDAPPLIDVRAPAEFREGSFPGAVNLPLLNDMERHEVGIVYKQSGNEKAVELGHQLVSGTAKEERVQAWMDFIEKNPKALLYCFRGGQRSRISQQWIYEAGKEIVRIEGGYKALRAFLIRYLDSLEGKISPYILGGRTGSGKTDFILKFHETLDLEKNANHRGSSFGANIQGQPTQIHFENSLAYSLLPLVENSGGKILLEDEGKNVGKLYLPPKLLETFYKGKLLILETPMAERIENIYREYVLQDQKEYMRQSGERGLELWHDLLHSAMGRIERRLGGLRHRNLMELFFHAWQEQKKTGRTEEHKAWIEFLLQEYYDPMYDYQIAKKKQIFVFAGSQTEIRDYLLSQGFTVL